MCSAHAGHTHVVKPIGADDADANVFTILVCFYRGTGQMRLTPQLAQPRNVSTKHYFIKWNRNNLALLNIEDLPALD